MDPEVRLLGSRDAEALDQVVELIRQSREDILRDWIERVRVNRSAEKGNELSDPLLLDHVPQLLDTITDRLQSLRPREDAEQWAAIHGFSRRITGYETVETVMELFMFRRAIWARLSALNAPVAGACIAMERVDGMVDRAVVTSLKAFLDPAARMLVRREEDAAAPVPPPVGADPESDGTAP